jgi:hypothetical protein
MCVRARAGAIQILNKENEHLTAEPPIILHLQVSHGMPLVPRVFYAVMMSIFCLLNAMYTLMILSVYSRTTPSAVQPTPIEPPLVPRLSRVMVEKLVQAVDAVTALRRCAGRVLLDRLPHGNTHHTQAIMSRSAKRSR